MADSSKAVSALHDAITAFRKACGEDADCAKIITLADAVERQIEEDYPAEEKREKPGDLDEPETPVEKQPRTLRDAEKAARGRFAAARKQSTDSEK